MLKTIIKPRKFNDDEWKNIIQVRPKTILSSNSKLQKDGIWNFTLPAVNALVVIDGKLQKFNTCEGAGICKNFCYASSSSYSFDNSLIKHTRNLQFILSDPFEFVEQFVKEVKSKRNLTAIRWHDSADFNPKLWSVYKEIMTRLPNIRFYAYTKMVKFFKEMDSKEIQKNLTLIFSYGGIHDRLIDRNKDRHARIFNSRAELRKAKYTEAYKSDKPASNPKNMRIGLIVHGSAVAMNIMKKNDSINIMNRKIK